MKENFKNLKAESWNAFLISEQGPLDHKSNYLSKNIIYEY